MRTPTATALLLAALTSIACSEELSATDVPSACTAICGPMVTLTNTCDINPGSVTARMRRRRADNDNQGDDESDETIEAQCICRNTSFDVGGVAALCAACISQNGKNTDGKKLLPPARCGLPNSYQIWIKSCRSVVSHPRHMSPRPRVLWQVSPSGQRRRSCPPRDPAPR